MRTLLPLLATLLFGCAHAPECSAHDGPRWSALQSPHFSVRTDLPLAVAHEHVVMLERVRQALLPSFDRVADGGRVDVLLLHDAYEVQNVSNANFVSGTLTSDWRGPLLILSADAYPTGTEPYLSVLSGALAMHYAKFSFRRLPRWVDEGLAYYLSTLAIDLKANVALRGKMDLDLVEIVRRWGVLKLDDLWTWDEPGDVGPGRAMHLRASAWLWFHYLSNAWSVRLTTFLVSLESGEDPHRAFDAAFIGLTQAQLFEGAESHLFRGAFSSQRVTLPVSVPGVQYRAMTDSEVHATLSRARAATGNWDAARLEANAAIALDANLPVAREAQLLTEREPATRLELARRYANDQPRRSTAALLLALNLPAGLERTAALELAVNLDPHDEIALSELANARLAAGRRTEALELAKNAAAQAPYSLRALVAWAATLAADGQCQTAVAVLQRALDYARLPASSKRLRDLEERLQRYQRCEVAPVAAR